MGRPKKVIDASLASKAKEILANVKEHKIAIRLQAIVSSANQPISTVASVIGVSRQTIWRWIRQFRENGIEGLKDLPKGHNPAKLNPEQQKQIYNWLSESENSKGESIHWTLESLKLEILNVFGISVGRTPLWLLIKKQGFRQKVPRPSHIKADKEAQEAFKKKLLK